MSPGRPKLCWPRSAPGRRLADELARCDREIAEIQNRADVRSGLVPAWLATLGIEDWQAERRLIEREKDGPMVIWLAWWEGVRERFDAGESAKLHCAVVGETVAPAGVAINPRELPRELREKVEDLLDGNRTRTARV